jgi:hypothetical protein
MLDGGALFGIQAGERIGGRGGLGNGRGGGDGHGG